VEDRGPFDFGCTPSRLVLGGGGGEHPAMILADMAGAAAVFLRHAVESWEDTRQDWQPSKRASIRDGEWARLEAACDGWELPQRLRFPGWDLKTYADFRERCLSRAVPTPYDAAAHGSLEDWLVACLGELVYFSMPELIASPLSELPDTCTQVREPILCNVFIPPPGFRLPYGKVVTHTGKVV
jgi:hypothetical protein